MTTIVLPANSARALTESAAATAAPDAARNAFVAGERAGGVEGRLIAHACDLVDDGAVEDFGDEARSSGRGSKHTALSETKFWASVAASAGFRWRSIRAFG